jgi:hypothetical protein
MHTPHSDLWFEKLRLQDKKEVCLDLRVGDTLNFKTDLATEMSKVKTSDEAYRSSELPESLDYDNLYVALDRIFLARNHLVHEIDISIIGHYTLREAPSVEDAINYGKLVVNCIKLIEGIITKNAPRDFPNRLGEDWIEEDELEKLTARIADVETDIKTKVDKHDQGSAPWNAAVMASQAALAEERAFIGQARFLHPVRHLDFRRAVQIELLKSRLAFLLHLKSELDEYDAA